MTSKAEELLEYKSVSIKDWYVNKVWFCLLDHPGNVEDSYVVRVIPDDPSIQNYWLTRQSGNMHWETESGAAWSILEHLNESET